MSTKWLTIAFSLGLFNGTLVLSSMVNRHVLTPVEPFVDASKTQDEAKFNQPDSGLSAEQRLKNIPVPELSVQQALPVADSDPLMAELKKQASAVFPEAMMGSEVPQDGALPNAQAVSPDRANRIAASSLAGRFRAIKSLCDAVVELTELADSLEAAGQSQQAAAIRQQTEEIAQTIKRLLNKE